MTEHVLRAAGLSKKFGKVEALRDVSFSIRKGLITSLLGENGAGKTTAIKLILGFLKKDSGVFDMKAARVGYVPEHPLYFPWLTGKEILVFTAKFYGLGKNRLEELTGDLSRKINFDGSLLSRKVQAYSLGNRKKFSYLQNLILLPDFLIVDEPFNALDPVSIKKVRDLFLEWKCEGRTLFLSSHIISEAEKISDEFVIIKKGRTVIQDNFREFKRNHLLYRLEKKGIGKDAFRTFSRHVRETDSRFELFVEKSSTGAFEQFLERHGLEPEKSEADLETIYLFFSA